MKRNQLLSLPVAVSIFGCFALLTSGSRCQQLTPAAASSWWTSAPVTPHVVWDGVFGGDQHTPNAVYCLMGSGSFVAPTSPNFKGLVSLWLPKHPKARVVRVYVMGPVTVDQPASEMIYAWVVDGSDTLNEYLVRQGGCPGGTMMIPDTRSYHAGVPRSGHFNVLVPHQEYARFIKIIAASEAKAQKAKLGIWKNGTDID